MTTPFVPLLELGEAVERSPDGIPKAWRILKLGDNPLTLRGETKNLVLGEDQLKKIVEYHKAKGCKIPIDSRHFI